MEWRFLYRIGGKSEEEGYDIMRIVVVVVVVVMGITTVSAC